MGNFRMVGPERVYTIDDATYKLTPRGLRWNGGPLFVQSTKRGWAALIRNTMPLRHRLGIRRDRLERLTSLFGRSRATRK